MKKHFLLTIVLILFFTGINAQEKRMYIGNGLSAPFTETPGYYKQTTFYDSFWNMESGFKYGKMIMVNDSVVDNLGLRYNLSRDRFEAIFGSHKGIFIANDSVVKYISMMGESFTNYRYLDSDGILTKGYFKIIGDGKTQLLFKKTEIHKQGKKGAYGHDASKVFKNNYYLKIPGRPYPVKVKLRKKDILNALQYKGPRLEVYAKEHHLWFSKENDLVSILAYYDKLKSEAH